MSESLDDYSNNLHECDDQLIAILRQLYDATLAPRFQVLITQGFVELMVNAVIDAKCKNAKKITSNSRDFPYSIKLILLNELGLISDNLFQVLNQLRKHRNDAAHDPFFCIPGTVAVNGQSAGPLHEYCISVIVAFYNLHREILSPLVAPTLSSTGQGKLVVFPTQYRVKARDPEMASEEAD